MRGALFVVPILLSFLLLLAVVTFGIYGNVELFNGDYFVNIELDSLQFAYFTYGSVTTLSPRVVPLEIGGKLYIVSYFYTNFEQSLRASNQFIFCLINDISDDYSSMSELNELLSNGGTLRLGKENFFKGFILPGSFSNTLVNSSSYEMLPDVYYTNNNEFPSFYEIQGVFFDVLLNVENNSFVSAYWSFPEGERPSFNLYVSPYYWFKGSLFYYDYMRVELNLPIFDFEFPTIDGIGDVIPFVRSIFEFLNYFIEFVRSMYRSTVNLIGSMFYGIAPLKFIFYS